MSISTQPTLPKDPESLAYILQQHAFREEYNSAFRWLRWMIADAYLNGARVFETFDLARTTINAHVLTQDGKLPVQVSDLLDVVNKTVGVLQAADLRPLVQRNDMSRAAVRERAVAQILADSLFAEDHINRIKTPLMFYLTVLGCVGLHCDVTDRMAGSLTGELEVVHPRELFPFPSTSWNYALTSGVMRQRLVPIDMLKERYGKSFKGDVKDKLYLYDREIGQSTADINTTDGFNLAGNMTLISGAGPSTPGGNTKTMYTLVKVRELWLDGPRGTCSRYVCSSGRHIFEDVDYEGKEVYCPIAIARFLETGRFHGAGLFDLLFSMVREFEKMVRDMISNIKALGRFPVALVPHGIVNEKVVARETGEGFRFVTYSPDPSLGERQNLRPITLAPPNSGDAPGRTAQFLKEMIREVTPLRDLLKEKGRVESMAGLQFLDEEAKRSVVVATDAVSRMFGHVYKSGVSQACRRITMTRSPIPVSRLSLDLAGAVIDDKTNTVSFANNPLPDISRLSFTVKDVNPKATSARLAQALQLAELQTKSGHDGWFKFVTWCVKNGIEIETDIEDYEVAYGSFVQKALRLYNDGVTPGQIVLNPATELPGEQLRWLNTFMASPKMAYGNASADVQRAFIEWQRFLKQQMNPNMLPEAAPDPLAMQPPMGQPSLDGVGAGLGPPSPFGV